MFLSCLWRACDPVLGSSLCQPGSRGYMPAASAPGCQGSLICKGRQMPLPFSFAGFIGKKPGGIGVDIWMVSAGASSELGVAASWERQDAPTTGDVASSACWASTNTIYPIIWEGWWGKTTVRHSIFDQLTCSLPRWRDADIDFCICRMRPCLLAAWWWVSPGKLAEATLAFKQEFMGYLQQLWCSNAVRIFGGCLAKNVLLHFIVLPRSSIAGVQSLGEWVVAFLGLVAY